MNQMLALNNPQEVDMLLNQIKPTSSFSSHNIEFHCLLS